MSLTEIDRLGRLAPMDERKERVRRILESGPVVPLRDLLQEVKILGKGGMKSVAVYMIYPDHPEEPGVIKKTCVQTGSLWKYIPPKKGKYGAQIVDPPQEEDGGAYGVEIPDAVAKTLKGTSLKFDELVKVPGAKTPDGKEVPLSAPIPEPKKAAPPPPTPTPPTPPSIPATVAPGVKLKMGTFKPVEPPPEVAKPTGSKETPVAPPEAPKGVSTKLTKAYDLIKAGEDEVGDPTPSPMAEPPKKAAPTPPEPTKPKFVDMTDPKVAAPAAPPLKPKPEPKPEPPPPPPPTLKLPSVDSLPSPEDMKKVGSGQYLGGAGEKTIYEKGKKKYIYKVAAAKSGSKAKPYAAHVQESIARIMAKVKPDSFVPIKFAKDESGRPGTVQPLLDLDSPATLAGMDPSKLTDQEKTDVATEHMIDWLFSQHDSHGANLIRVGGRVLGVDKEQAYKYFGTDKLDTEYHPNSAYGENEPYYNTFWRAFAEGKVDFDPKKMRDVLEKIEGIKSEDFDANLLAYAHSLWGAKSEEVDSFVAAARARKLHLRRDFEKFVTKQYQKRTGKEGAFTFDDGWVVAGEKPKKKLITKYAKDLAEGKGLTVREWKPGGVVDPDHYSIRLPVSKESKELLSFLKKMKIEPQADPIKGGQYWHVKVKKADWDAAKIEEEEEITDEIPVKPQPAQPKYFPDVVPYKKVPPGTIEDLKTVQDKMLGRAGYRIGCDGGSVEGQAATVRRVIGPDKKPEYVFALKLRRSVWQKYESAGSSSSYQFKEARYDAKKDALVEHKAGVWSMPSRQLHSSEAGSVHLCTDTHQFAFTGTMMVRVPEEKGKSPDEALRSMLDKVDPELRKEIFRNPTPEEIKISKMMKLLWSQAPATARKLKEGDQTVANLTKLLDALPKTKESEFTSADVDKIEEVAIGSGFSASILRGRHKKGKLKKLAFFYQSRKDVKTLIDVLQYGCLSTTERVAAGRSAHGGISTEQDVNGGGGDSAPSSVATRSAVKNGSSMVSGYGPIHFIISPEEADRLDLYAWPSDTYMKCNDHSIGSMPSVEDTVEKVDGYGAPGSSEACHRRMVPVDKILRVATSGHQRETFIRECKKAGIMEVNGVPIDDFIVSCSSVKDAYEKYVKPMGF